MELSKVTGSGRGVSTRGGYPTLRKLRAERSTPTAIRSAGRCWVEAHGAAGGGMYEARSAMPEMRRATPVNGSVTSYLRIVLFFGAGLVPGDDFNQIPVILIELKLKLALFVDD